MANAAQRTVVLAVVGAGAWGKNHVRNFASLPGVELRYICDASGGVREAMARSYPAARVLPDASEPLLDPELDGVVVATPAAAHHAVALASLQRGKDVFVEKPLTLHATSSEELCRIAEERGAMLMVGHLLLYHPAIDALRGMIDRGELGEVLYITSQRLNLGVVRRDENAWWSLAPHDVSVASFLLGARAEAVTASGGVYLQKDRGVEDVVFATLHYPGGRLAHVHVSWLDPHKTRRITVVGSQKMAVFDDGSADMKLAVYDKGIEAPPAAVSYEEGVRVRTGDIRMPVLRMEEPLRRECQAFVDAIRSRTRPRADGRSGLEVVRVLEAGSRSLAEGGRKIFIHGAERA